MNPDTFHKRRWWTLAVLCLCLFVVSLDNTILNVALPTLQSTLNTSASQLQWISLAATEEALHSERGRGQV